MSGDISPAPAGQFIIYDDQDGNTRLDVRFDGETVWLTQAQIAELMGTTRENITLHIGNVYDECELDRASTCKDFLLVRQEGSRQVAREVAHYNLDMIISVGYRVKSQVATRFRIWATQVLREYITKGFALDDERLKVPGGIDYWDELNKRIRAIRASELRFYQKVRDLFAQTSVDYDRTSEVAKAFFATIQNKLLYAVTGHTAAELIAARCASSLPSFGLTTWPAVRPTKADAMVAKNYLSEDEISELDTLVEQFLAFADRQVRRKRVTTMDEWVTAVDDMLSANRDAVLAGPGHVSHTAIEALVGDRWAIFDANRRADDRQRAIEAEAADLRRLVETQRQVKQVKGAIDG